MTKTELKEKIINIYKVEKDISKTFDVMFEYDLADEVLDHYNGYSPMEALVRGVKEIISEYEE